MLQALRNLVGRNLDREFKAQVVARSERLFAQVERLDIGSLFRLARSFVALTHDDPAGRPELSAQVGTLAMDWAKSSHRMAFARQLRKRTRRLVWDTWWVEDGPNADQERAEREAAIEAICWTAWAILLADLLPPSLVDQLKAPWTLAMGDQAESDIGEQPG